MKINVSKLAHNCNWFQWKMWSLSRNLNQSNKRKSYYRIRSVSTRKVHPKWVALSLIKIKLLDLVPKLYLLLKLSNKDSSWWKIELMSTKESCSLQVATVAAKKEELGQTPKTNLPSPYSNPLCKSGKKSKRKQICRIFKMISKT